MLFQAALPTPDGMLRHFLTRPFDSTTPAGAPRCIRRAAAAWFRRRMDRDRSGGYFRRLPLVTTYGAPCRPLGREEGPAGFDTTFAFAANFRPVTPVAVQHPTTRNSGTPS